MFPRRALLGLCLSTSAAFAQAAEPVELGRLETGATVAFVADAEGRWGIEIAATPPIRQAKPAMIEVYRSDQDIHQLAAGYKTVEKSDGAIDAVAEIADGDVTFQIRDHWTLDGAVLSVRRKVEVTGNAEGGFYSTVVLAVDPATGWDAVHCLVPGLLYGDPTHDGAFSPGGTQNHAARRFFMREDILAAPLFGLSFKGGASVAVLNPTPRGDTTLEETTAARPVVTDARLKFGALGAWQSGDGPVEFGFRYPGSTDPAGGAAARGAAARGAAARGGRMVSSRAMRRYHPIAQDVDHAYEVRFRFGQEESFPDLTRNAWRWAWNTLDPPVHVIDVEQMRRVLTDHLVSQVATIDGRTAMPFVINTITDEKQWNYTMVAMGFVGKNLECADQLLREADRDKTQRGQKMRETGLAMIESMIGALVDVPLMGTGYDLETGGPWTGDHQEWVAPWLRNATEGMRVVMRAYRRERALGRDHPEWPAWVKLYTDWLILQQREDGSFPRRWKPGSSEVEEASGTTSYNPVPLLVLMSEETGDPKYQQAAIRAAEYVWENFGSRGVFVGGTIDNANVTDKEAGMLSLEAFLSLYEATKEPKWLERAETAATFAESWIWIWTVPMPLDAEDAQLHWKKDVPAIGFQGIAATAVGAVDQYMDWSVPSYAKLYRYTDDEHYLDVARVLLHDTKAMVALPGRQYDLKAVGFQQEGWGMGPGRSGRGVGGHRFWLPWISANHLYGITGLEEFDKELFDRLSKGQ